MTTTQHTPGPWVIDDGLIRAEEMAAAIESNPTWVAVGINDEDGFAASVAYCHPINASLIAATPDLLSALQSSADWLDELCGLIQSGMFDAASDWVGANAVSTDSTLRAAIFKAKGGE